MLQKPAQYVPEYAEPFKDPGVVGAYRHRLSYPAEVFDILARLIGGGPRHVLDAGCGAWSGSTRSTSRGG